jgi:hypothetical protein
MKRKYEILIHCAVWAGWLFIINSWILISWTKQPIIPLIYNNLSLIIVFYSTRWMASLYWRDVENNTLMWVDANGDINQHCPGNWQFYVWKKPILGIICIALAYINLAWLADGIFAKHGLLAGRYPHYYYYTYSKWMTESFYVCGGNVMAAIEYHLRKEASKRFMLEENSRRKSEENKLLDREMRACLERLERRNRNREDDF